MAETQQPQAETMLTEGGDGDGGGDAAGAPVDAAGAPVDGPVEQKNTSSKSKRKNTTSTSTRTSGMSGDSAADDDDDGAEHKAGHVGKKSKKGAPRVVIINTTFTNRNGTVFKSPAVQAFLVDEDRVPTGMLQASADDQILLNDEDPNGADAQLEAFNGLIKAGKAIAIEHSHWGMDRSGYCLAATNSISSDACIFFRPPRTRTVARPAARGGGCPGSKKYRQAYTKRHMTHNSLPFNVSGL